MQRAQLRANLIEWLDDQFHFGDAEMIIAADDASWMENGVLDSLGFVQLILHLEDSLGIKIERGALSRDNFDSMDKVLNYVLAHPQVVGR